MRRGRHDEDDEDVVPGPGPHIPNIKRARLDLWNSPEAREFKWPIASGRLANHPLLLGADTLPRPT